MKHILFLVLAAAHFSSCSSHRDRQRIPGPLGAVTKGTKWTLKKLFVLN